MKNKLLMRIAAFSMATLVITFSVNTSVYAVKSTDQDQKQEEQEEQEESEDYENARHITSAKELVEFAEECKVGSSSQNLTVVLDKDIDMAGVNDFNGIDTFSGHFDGNGHTVKGINLNEGSGSIGFFGFIEAGAVVENLTVDGTIYSTDKNNYIGIIAGTNAGTIQNCVACGIATGTGNTAGVVGYNGGEGVVTDCENQAKVYSLTLVAGIAGENRGLINNCVNKGQVNADSSWLDFEDDSVDTLSVESIVKNIYDTIEIGSDIGGITGYSHGTITACTNEGIVGYQHAGKNVGGITGRFTGTIEDCTNAGKVYGKQDVGGIAGQFEPTILETGADMSSYVKELGDLSDQLMKDTQAAGASSESAMKKAAKSIRETGDKTTGDINKTTNDITGKITDESNRGKQRIEDAGDTIKNLQNDLTKVDGEKAIEDARDDIAGIDYNGIVNKIDNISNGIDKAQKAVKNYDVSDTENDAKRHIDSKTKSGVDAINDASKSATDTINDTTNKAANELDEISDSISQTRDTLTKDINAINAKVADIASLASEQADNFKRIAEGDDIIEDYSAVDPENEEASRIRNCDNKGYVNGDRNVGGIAGALAIEGTDANDEARSSAGNRYVTVAVLEDSNSNGIIELRKENAGGIVGNSSLGLIRNCEVSDRIISEEGNYIGGVAGYAKGTVSDCYSLSMVEGKNYVGGISGAAKKLRGCYSMAEINADAKWGGAIIGDVINDSSEDITTAHSKMMNSIFNNYYVKDTFAGINNVSYSGIAEAISYEAVLASAVGRHFEGLKVYFYNSDYELASTQDVDYGMDIAELKYPNIDTEENMHLVWNGIYSNNINGNMYLVAEDADDVTVLSSDRISEGKPIALVQGIYYEISKLIVEENTKLEPPKAKEKESNISCYDVHLENTSMGKEDESQIRFLVGKDKNARVYIWNNKGWKPVASKITGSYVESKFKGTEATFAIESYDEDNKWFIVGAIAVIIVVILLLVAIRKLRSKKKKPANK